MTSSISTAEEKERLVLMPLQGSGVEAKYKPMMESSIAEGLFDRYEVLYGRNVEVKIKEIYKKLSEETAAGQECDDTKCMQEIGIEFQAELVATIKVVKNPQGYFLALNIINIYDNKLVLSESEPCEGCNEFQVIRILKQMAGGTSKSEEEKIKKAEEERKIAERKRAREDEHRKAAAKKKRREEDKRLAEQKRLEEEKRREQETKQTSKAPAKGMVFIKGGCFDMGDTFGDGQKNEKPVHKVCVNDFYLGEYEVTQREWEQIMGNNPSHFKNCGGDCPVEYVSWNDVQQYIRKLNDKTGMKYRLPTEAEWEYAARSGGRKEKYAGTSNKSDLVDHAWYRDNSGKKTHPLKTKKPNSLGLYDMSGNVWEWVSDWYDKNYYKNSPKDNPKGPASGVYKILRGGSWFDIPRDLRATGRVRLRPGVRITNFGFRIAQD
jgi:formylglycine-generating enzyme required for sulfatase activity